MTREQRIGRMAEFFPRTKLGHGGLVLCRMGCEVGTDGEKRHNQDRYKVAERYEKNGGKPEHASPLKKAKDEGFVSGEISTFRGEAIILPFDYGERVLIRIPALNLKFGASKEYPQGYAGSLVGRDNHGRNFLVKLEKAWRKSKKETIKEIWTPAALLARASVSTN